MPESPQQKNIVHAPITAGGNVHIGDYLVTYHNYFAAQEVKIPHRLTNNIPTNADHILGRTTELAQAHDLLAQHQATVLFNGIGGIGKTALASKYMAVYGCDYKHLAWITVQSNLAEAFINNAPLLAALQITQQVQNYIVAKQLDKAFEFLFHQLNLLERTLVVIDNANDLDDLDQYKNWFDTAHSHFLITSRSQPSEWATVEVDSLPEDEAVRLFRKLHPSVSSTDKAIKSLLLKLFYHTLLIELVAKAVASTGIAFAELQMKIETKFIHDEQLNEDIVTTGKHGNYYETKRAKIEEYIWLIFSNVKNLGDDAKQILRGMALLPLAMPFEREFLKTHLVMFEVKEIVANLSLLVERGWLQKENERFWMHPLIADVVVEHLDVNVEFASNYSENLSDLVGYDVKDTTKNLLDANKYKCYADRIVSMFFEENSQPMAVLLNCLAVLEHHLGNIYHAVNYGRRALNIVESFKNFDIEELSNLENNLGTYLLDIGEFEDAISLLKKSLKNALCKFDESHSVVTSRQNNLASIYKEVGKFKEAITLLKQALKNDLKNFDKTHPTIANRQSNLGNLYLLSGRFDKAIHFLETAYKIDLKNYTENHHVIAIRRANLGNAYGKMGKYSIAIELLEKSIASDFINFGEWHPELAKKQFMLAQIYFNMNKIEESKELLKITYLNYSNCFRSNHPYIKSVESWIYNVDLVSNQNSSKKQKQ